MPVWAVRTEGGGVKFKVFSSPGCIRCKRAKKALAAQGHEIEEHDAEFHRLPSVENWRDRPTDFKDFLATLSEQGDELPVIYSISGDRFLTYEEAMNGN